MQINNNHYLPIIKCRRPVDNDGKQTYLRKVCGVSLIRILAERLKRVGDISTPVMILHQEEPETVREAKGFGWIPLIKNRWRFKNFLALPEFFKSDYFLLFDLDFPFIDPDILKSVISRIQKDTFSGLFSHRYSGFSPVAVVRKKEALLGVLKKYKYPDNVGWLRCVEDLIPEGKSDKISIQRPVLSHCLRSDTVNSKIIEILGGLGVTLESILVAEESGEIDTDRILKISRDRLYQRMQHSSAPHWANRDLIQFESRHAITEVRSFPMDLAITITGACSARCLFCNYKPGYYQSHDHFTLQDFKKMTWLKYLSKLGLGGGVGDPLAHPGFLKIFHHLREAYPHLLLRVITNGILMNREIREAFSNSLSRLRISMNAATKETYKKIMRIDNFDKLCRSVSQLSRLKRKMKTDKPEIILMMVVNRLNAHEVVRFVELSHRLGVQAVNFSHFAKVVMTQSDMPMEDSLYSDQKYSDLQLGRAEKRAKALGLGLSRPSAFTEKGCLCFQGERFMKVPEMCYFPWTTAYLVKSRTPPYTDRLQFCCVGVESAISYKRESLSTENFVKLWNHPYLQHYRKTVNSSQKNPVCRFCRTVDQADPNNYEFCSKMRSGGFIDTSYQVAH